MSRDQILADALRLEDKELDAHKDLWLLGWWTPSGEIVVIMEAVTAPGATANARTLELLPDGVELKIHGPHARGCWPEAYWYRWLTEEDVARMEAEIGGQ